MKRWIFTLLLSMSLLGFSKATVIFDPATIPVDSLKPGMTLVTIDGTVYLQTVLNGWNSAFNLPASVTVPAGETMFKVKSKFAVGTSGFALSNINAFIQPMGATDADKFNIGAQATTDITLFTATAKPGAVVKTIQVAGQERTGWSAVVGDTIWIGKIVTYDPLVMFDPAAFDGTLPTGMSIVNVDGKMLLKVVLDGWNTSLTIPGYAMGANNKWSVEAMYKVGTGGFAIGNINAFIQPMGAAAADKFNLGAAATATLNTYTALDAKPSITITSIQFAGQETTNWSALVGDTMYVGIIKVWSVVPPVVDYVDPRKTVDIENIDDAVIDFDGLALEDFWVDQDLYTVNGGGDSATFSAEFSAGWDEDYLYLFVEVADDSVFDYVDDPADSWEKDGIQVYVDVRNQLVAGAKDDEQQHQITMPFSAGDYPFATYVYAGAGVDATGYYVQDSMTAYMAGRCVKSTSSYTMELRLPWAAMYMNSDDVKTKEQCEAAVSVAVNTVVGFELQVNDYNGDAATGSRKNIVTWSAISTDNPGSYQNSGIWGGLKLVNTSAIDQSLSNAARIYPNPNNGQFTVELEGMNSINIYDVTGRQVYTQLVTSDNAVINAENLVKGIYFVQVNTNGNSAIQKIEIR